MIRVIPVVERKRRDFASDGGVLCDALHASGALIERKALWEKVLIKNASDEGTN